MSHLNRTICHGGVALALIIMALNAVAMAQGDPRGEAVLDEVAGLVTREFLDPDLRGLDWPARVDHYRPRVRTARTPDELAEVINALLGELGTSHTGFYPPTVTGYFELLDIFNRGAFAERIKPLFPDGVVRYCGIGVVTRRIDDRLFLADVLETSPAAEAGLLVGDEVIDVDGRSFEPIESFRDRVEEDVVLRIRRVAGEAPFAVTVRPRWIVPHELYLEAQIAGARIIEHQGRRLACVRIRSYAGLAYQEALEELVAFGPLADAEGLLLDLRGGWGGADPRYLNLYHRRVPELTMIPREGESIQFTTQWTKPVAMLIDEGTRSGKEILAYAFRAYDIGPVIGVNTAGAVVGGRPFLLESGDLLLLAVSDALVDGKRLEGVGVAPDVEVEFALPYARGRNPQRERALGVLADQIPD